MVRTLAIHSPSARREAWAVGRAIFHIAYWCVLVVSAETYAPASSSAAQVQAFERRFQDLDAADQRIFRALREGVAEAERRRSATGRWPSADELARDAIPPFARDPLDRARHAWTTASAGTATIYVGAPEAAGRDTIVARIVEPEPGTPSDPQATIDEIHHRLDDGTMLHVTVWMGPGMPGDAASPPPPEKGWRQIVVAAKD